MIRDFDPEDVSARMPAVLVLGYALSGDRECARILRHEFEKEERAAKEQGRPPKQDDYVLAWLADANLSFIKEGKSRPRMREITRALGLVRKAKPGNAPNRFDALRTHALVEREHRAHPRGLREVAKQRVAALLEGLRPLRKGAASKYKMVESHEAEARKILGIEERLRAARSVDDLADAPAEVIAKTHAEVAAFRRGLQALSLLEHPSERTELLLKQARVRGAFD